MGPSDTGFESLSASANTSASAAKRLLPSPGKFTRVGHLISEGAVYGRDGKVLCILKGDAAAYAFNDDPALAEALSNETRATGQIFASEGLCEQIRQKSVKLTIPNGDLLNRLLWTMGEGSCNPVASDVIDANGKPVMELQKAREKNPEPIQFATFYHGFALNGLRKLYASEDDMLKKACNGGKGRDFFKSYFEEGQGNTKPYFNLLLDPSKWQQATAAEACRSDTPALKIKHCMRSILSSVIPAAPDPTGGVAFWRHDDAGCAKNNLKMKVRIGGAKSYAHDVWICFREKFLENGSRI